MSDDDYRRAVSTHADRLHGYAAWVLADREEARDVAQEALVRLWQHRADVGFDAARSWLLRTAYRLCIDRLRAQGRGANAVDGSLLDELVAHPTAGPERTAVTTDLLRSVGRALARLSASDRAILLMRESQGLSYAEMADALSIGLGAVKVRLHRARGRLREVLVEAGVQR